MFNLKVFFVILIGLSSSLCFAEQIDPAIGSETGFFTTTINKRNDNDNITTFGSRDLVPPTFEISHTENGDVTINVNSDEDLYSGWVDEKLVWSVANFDYWWLNTRMAKDDENNIYAAVRLYEYANPSGNFDMIKLLNNGEIEEENFDWIGPGGNTVIINNPDQNIYIGQPTLDKEGVVDHNNITYVASNNATSNILFTKIDADGTVLINNEIIITGANGWTNEIRIAVDSNDKIYLVWSKSQHDISYAYSEDGGISWSDIISLCYLPDGQQNKPQIYCDSNDNVHIIWSRYLSGHYLKYMKLRPDGTIAIDASQLTSNNNSPWSPKLTIDEENNVHIVWANGWQGTTSAYYTKINGNLDADGASLTDAELTLIQEYGFVLNQNVRYPKCTVDDFFNVHSIYENDEYGCNHPKNIYHKKMNSIPLLRIECPNDSVLFVEMTGSGTGWEGVFTPSELGIYDVRVSASDSNGNTGVDNYQFEYTGIPSNGFITGTISLEDGTGNVEDVTVIAGSQSTSPDVNGLYSIEIELGTYIVTATLDGYDQETIEGVIVEGGQTTSGIDFILNPTVGLEDNNISLTTKLLSNFPNPFNPTTTISFNLTAKDAKNAKLEIFNTKGKKVRTFSNLQINKSLNQQIIWDGTDENNQPVSSGMYFYKLKAGNFTKTKKCILLK
ncbi:MAG: T9SS type A sorting domain-containing protein [Candidatus Cloacimonetes bacterium]|nr:T9SS type A sorting domain-containing protein [Candidatus Cloacimonadota bacterium]